MVLCTPTTHLSLDPTVVTPYSVILVVFLSDWNTGEKGGELAGLQDLWSRLNLKIWSTQRVKTSGMLDHFPHIYNMEFLKLPLGDFILFSVCLSVHPKIMKNAGAELCQAHISIT